MENFDILLNEDRYEVQMPQYRFPGDVEDRFTTDDIMEWRYDNSTGESSVISNLPLLFANGYPTSLEKITLVQLERFITFMVKCSLEHNTTDKNAEPRWWPKEMKFSNPLTRPKKVNENWMASLKKLVFRCYTYHRNEYLLRFCSYLAQYPHEELEYVNNWDSTTSLYHKSNGQLLVTFRNENMNYDKKSENPRKKLLSCNGATSGYPSKSKRQQQQHSPVMVEPPTEDIYLCDSCDAEFLGLEKMKEHERTCCEQQDHPANTGSRPNTPDASASEPELRQDQFLQYFHLRSTSAEAPSSERSNHDVSTVPKSVPRRTSGRVRGSISFTRCPTIPFSSPAGILLAKKSKAMTAETQQERLERIERHLVAPVLSDTNRPKWLDGGADRDRWIVTHKPSRDKPPDDYVHQYKFVNSVKRKPMLSIQSQLLYIFCRPVYVLLTRLNDEQIMKLKRDASSCRCPVRRFLISKRTPCSPTSGIVRMSASSKRKAPGDESDAGDSPEIEVVPVSRPTNTMSSAASNLEERVAGPTKFLEPVNGAAAQRSKSADTTITVIDLCSSDEEDDRNALPSTDENTDPMNSTDTEITKSLLRKLTPCKQSSQPCNYAAVSTNDWLAGNIFDESGENCTNRYRSNVTLNACAQLSPILRPAP